MVRTYGFSYDFNHTFLKSVPVAQSLSPEKMENLLCPNAGTIQFCQNSLGWAQHAVPKKKGDLSVPTCGHNTKMLNLRAVWLLHCWVQSSLLYRNFVEPLPASCNCWDYWFTSGSRYKIIEPPSAVGKILFQKLILLVLCLFFCSFNSRLQELGLRSFQSTPSSAKETCGWSHTVLLYFPLKTS